MTPQQLHDHLIAEGCNHFFIVGVGGPTPDDVEALGFEDGKWKVYYLERGLPGEVLFASPDWEAASAFYLGHVMGIQHSHMVLFTRSREKRDNVRQLLERAGIPTHENDIPNYQSAGDHVYRLFVTGKDIFAAMELLGLQGP